MNSSWLKRVEHTIFPIIGFEVTLTYVNPYWLKKLVHLTLQAVDSLNPLKYLCVSYCAH